MSAAGEAGQGGLLLRREPFGALLFAPGDALHLELDHEAFVFLREHLIGRRAPQGEDEAALLERVRAEVARGAAPGSAAARGELSGAPRLVDYPDDVEGFEFRVYNAPTLADFQITTRCTAGCAHCYAAAGPDGAHVALPDIAHVLDELACNGITQVALGGGEPLCHPDLVRVLELCRERGMVPSLTTNGLELDDARLDALARCCGAVALSLEGVGAAFDRVRRTGFDRFRERLGRLLGRGINTVLQVTLSRESFAGLDAIVDFCLQAPGLYGVIFLAYKQVGRGRHFDHVLAELDPAMVHAQLRAAFLALSRHTRVGYDCCLTPGIVGLERELDFTQHDQLEGCSALRSSVGVLPSLDVVPCTFTGGLVLGNLGEQPLYDIWRGAEAQRFRQRVQQRLDRDARCAGCAARLDCLGGCPVFELVGCRG